MELSYIFMITVLLNAVSDVSPRWCDSHYETECKQEVCLGPAGEDETCQEKTTRCIKSKRIECIHGNCGYNRCRCDACWDGGKCDQYNNIHHPSFAREKYEAVAVPGTRGVLRGIAAFDKDSSTCVITRAPTCPCAQIYYTIVDADDLPWRFYINPRTGDLSYDVLDVGTDKEFLVEIAAVNTHHNGTVDLEGQHAGFATVRVLVTDATDNTKKSHSLVSLHPNRDVISWRDGPDTSQFQHRHRRRRAAGPGLPTTTEVSLVKLTPWESVTTIRPTDAVPFQHTVALPEGSRNISVTVYSAVETTSVYQICNPSVVTVGSNFGSLSSADISVSQISSDGITRFDEAIFHFGNVTNDASDVINSAASQIVLEFTLVALNNDLLTSGNNYSVYVVTSHSDEQYLVEEGWFEYHDIDTDAGLGYVLFLTGPSQLLPGASGTWDIEVVIFVGVSALSVSVVSMAPNHLTICDMFLVKEGDLIACYDEGPLAAKSIASGLLLNFGDVVNTGYNLGNVTSNEERSVTVRVIGSIPANAMIGDNYTLKVEGVKNGLTVSEVLHNVTVNISEPVITAVSPALRLSATSTVLIGGRSTIDCVLFTSPNHTAAYNVTFRSVTGSLYTLRFCHGTVNNTGDNLNCGDTSSIVYVSQDKQELTLVYDVLSNTGKISDISASEVNMSVIFAVLEDGTVSDGEVITMEATVTTGGSYVTTAIDLTAQTPNVTNDVITAVVANTAGITSIYAGGQGMYDVTLTLAPHAIYSNMQLTAQVVNTPPFLRKGLCSLALLEEECWSTTKINQTSNVFNPAFNDVMSLSAGTVINYDGVSASITVRVVVVLLTDNFVDGDVVETGLLLSYNDVTLDIGPASSIFSSAVPLIPQIPLFNVTQTSPQNEVTEDSIALFGLDITTPKLTLTSYRVRVTVNNPAVSVCCIRLKSLGSNIPCLSDDIQHTVTAYATGVGNEEIVYDLLTVSNIDVDDTIFADMLNLEVATQFRDGFEISSSTDYSVIFEVFYSNQLWSNTLSLAVATNSSSIPVAPVMTLEKHNNVHQICRGCGAVYVINIYTSPGSSAFYSLQVNTQMGISSIGDMRVIAGGSNVPCLNDNGNLTLISADNVTFHSATKDIGVVPNAGTVGPTLVDENKIRVEVVVGVPVDASATEGQSCTVSVVLTYGESQSTLQESLSYTITLSTLPQQVKTAGVAIMMIPPKPNPVLSFIGEHQTWEVMVILPETTDSFEVNVSLPVASGEALMTGTSASISFVGGNIAFPSNVQIQTTPVFGTGNSQMTTFLLNLGCISNVGTFNRYQFRHKNDTDDVIIIEVSIQIADHVLNIHGAENNITCHVTSNGGVSIETLSYLTIHLTGNEVADLNFTAWNEGFIHTDKMSGDTIKLYGSLAHTGSSNAHGTDIEVHYMLPFLSTFTILTNWTVKEPVVTVLPVGRGVLLQFPVVLFTDVLTFEFNITIDPQNVLPEGMSNVATVTLADMTYYTYQRQSRIDTAPHFTPLTMLEFGFDTAYCNSKFGIDTVLQDCQITASSFSPGRTPENIKTSSVVSWEPAYRYHPFCGQEYIQVNFGNQMAVKGIIIMSAGDDAINFVTNFTLQYSDDGLSWFNVTDTDTYVTQVFYTNFNITDKQVNDTHFTQLDLTHVFVARQVRLIPKSYYRTCKPSIRAAWVGCPVEINSGLDPCTPPVTKPFQLLARSYVMDSVGGTIFVCILVQIDDEVQCSLSEDYGDTWTDIDLTVGNIKGVTSNNTVAGISADGLSRMCSWDSGLTWETCQLDQYNLIVNGPTYSAAIDVQFVNLKGLTNDFLHGIYGFTTPTHLVSANNNGIAVKDIAAGVWTQVAWWGDSDWDML
ncbi:uncharacterized protein LOC117331700 [Pecten maximus]|uniref:uncharacterized protein LOC117331700 n=1 Tax=Pecten maximus TaxID=6579 RepID=UPI001458FC56|nr:uncharacterized protein LOC117331700 [Pecten maximus]